MFNRIHTKRRCLHLYSTRHLRWTYNVSPIRLGTRKRRMILLPMFVAIDTQVTRFLAASVDDPAREGLGTRCSGSVTNSPRWAVSGRFLCRGVRSPPLTSDLCFIKMTTFRSPRRVQHPARLNLSRLCACTSPDVFVLMCDLCSKELTIIKEEQAQVNSINSSIVSVKVTTLYLICLPNTFSLLVVGFVFRSAMPPVPSPAFLGGRRIAPLSRCRSCVLTLLSV